MDRTKLCWLRTKGLCWNKAVLTYLVLAQLKEWVHLSLHEKRYVVKGRTFKVASQMALAIYGRTRTKMVQHRALGLQPGLANFYMLSVDMAWLAANHLGIRWETLTVIMAEVCLAMLVYKLNSIQHLKVFAHFDDVQMTTGDLQKVRGLNIARKFNLDFIGTRTCKIQSVGT